MDFQEFSKKYQNLYRQLQHSNVLSPDETFKKIFETVGDNASDEAKVLKAAKKISKVKTLTL